VHGGHAGRRGSGPPAAGVDELFDSSWCRRAPARSPSGRAPGISFTLKKALTTRLKQHLPFELTGDQRQAIREITDDMLAPLRMPPAADGDVGTGKTVSRCSRCSWRSRTTTRRDHGADGALGRAAPSRR